MRQNTLKLGLKQAYEKYKIRLEILNYPEDVQWVKCHITDNNDIICYALNIGKNNILEIPYFVTEVKPGVIQDAVKQAGKIKALKVVHKNNHIKSMRSLFRALEIDQIDLSEFDTTNVIRMEKMFNSCRNIKQLDLQNFDFSSVIDMQEMFSSCNSLKDIKFSEKVNTSKVRYLENIFKYTAIEEFDLQKFNLQNLIILRGAFSDCTYLKTLKIDNLEQRNLTDIAKLCFKCKNLESLDLSKLDCCKVQNLNSLVRQCERLKYIILPKDLSNVSEMFETFAYCKLLVEIDLSNRNIKQLEQLKKTFIDCENLSKLKIEREYTKNVKDYDGTFMGCINVQQELISNIDTQGAKTTQSMFNFAAQRNNSKPIDFTILNTQNVEDLQLMFYGQRFPDGSNYQIQLMQATALQGFASNSNIKDFDFQGVELTDNIQLIQAFSNQSIERIQLGNCKFNGIQYSSIEKMVAKCNQKITIILTNISIIGNASQNQLANDIKSKNTQRFIRTIFKDEDTHNIEIEQ